MKKLAIAALLSLATISNALACDPTPIDAVRIPTEQIQAQIRAHHAEYELDRSVFYAQLGAIVSSSFDGGYTSKLALGKYWAQAKPEQRERFQSAFVQTLVRTYGDKFLDQGGAAEMQWEVACSRAVALNDTSVVRATVKVHDIATTKILFALRRVEGRWMVYDVAFEDLGTVTTFSTPLMRAARSQGLDAVSAQLSAEAGPTRRDSGLAIASSTN